ncbi:hypothetical protein LOTGIDRAFT_157467 [Lottia gigantea]|uniref:Spatacsin C-terminal domain-containing protein n=1 Tax=Lottia gigantea TaxID=225164 RepID=V4ABB1_LOTGI|nr:hypothetical protein LOTGIDRAFT_157467 [Lottia gigantea]ESP01289.1 hypothetical protein LOTGIDRAFT_157467 [Lottia gigantea]
MWLPESTGTAELKRVLLRLNSHLSTGAQLYNRAAFTICLNHALASVNILLNTVVWRINLNKSGVDIHDQTWWTVSQEMEEMVLKNGAKIHRLSLKNYLVTNPLCLLEDNLGVTSDRRAYSPNLKTYQTGDALWSESVSNLNLDQSKRAEPWYKRLFEKSSKTDAKVSGFEKERKPKISVSNIKYLQTFNLDPKFDILNVTSIVFCNETVSFVCEDDSMQTVSIIDMEKKTFSTQSIPRDQLVLLSEDNDSPHIIISHQYIIYVISNSQPDVLVSKMMLYDGATAADYLCHLNKWERGSIPIPALEVGLKHRQLDTVAFFLKSKENMSRQRLPISPSLHQDEASLWTPTYDHHDSIKNLEPVLFLLVETVKECAADNQSKNFAHNLLSLTLNYLYSLLHDGLDVSRSLGSTASAKHEKENLELALDSLMTLIAELRCCLKLVESKGIERRSSRLSDVADGQSIGSQDSSMKSVATSDKPIEVAVEAAVNENDLPNLQHQLLEQGRQSDYSNIIKMGVNTALNHLEKHQTSEAKTVLLSLGFDYEEKLWEIVLYVKDLQLQKFILNELLKSDVISQNQADLIKFTFLLHQHYPQHSFQQAFLIKNTSQSSSQWSDDNLKLTDTKSNTPDLTSLYGDIDSKSNSSVVDSRHYSEFILDWLQYWDNESKERVLLETQIMKPDFNMKEYKNHQLLWKFVLSHNLKTEALLLLDIIIKQFNSSSTEDRHSVIQWLWSSLKYCGSLLSTKIITELLRNGLFSEDLHVNMPRIMSELVKVGGVLQVPHPLTDWSDIDLFHLYFINYCVNHQLVHPLWSYCSLHRLNPEKIEIENADMIKWFQYFTKLFQVSQSTTCPNAIFEASFSSGRYIWSSDLDIADMIVQGHTLVAIATMSYSPSPIHQVIGEGGIFSQMDNKVLESALKPFPKLYSALIPSFRESTQNSDINLYQLLKDNAPFDVRRLFGWQDSNVLAGEDCQKTLPYFSQPELVSQFAYAEKLRFTYYLKQGRPCYAFLSFLAEELSPGTSTLSNKRIQTACGISLWVAVKNFTKPAVTSSCVAFVDMLGQDSILIRTFLQVASTILNHKNTGLVANIEKHKITMKNNEQEIISLLQANIRSRRKYSPKVLILLEEALCADIKSKNIPSCSFEAGEQWTLAVIFCHLQKLPLSTKFLEICAKSDKWLSFVWFAQYHQFPRQQLQGLLHCFHSRHLRDHLHYVIENADAKSLAPPSVQGASNPDKTMTKKDVRSSLYSKIGVTNSRETEEWSSEEEEEITLPPALELLVNQEKEVPTVTLSSAADDVFGVVFDAQNTPSPWKSLLTHAVILKNPLFAELAFCENDAAILPCLCGWLVSMMETGEHKKFLMHHGSSAIYKWSMKELEALMDVYLKCQWDFTLATAFDIFQPEIALLPFLKFSAEFIQRNNHDVCKLYLGDFKEAMYGFGQNREKEEEKLNELDDKEWIEKTVYNIILHHLTTQSKTYTLLHLLQLLDHENIALVFSFDVCEFGKLHKICDILHTNSIELEDFSSLLFPSNQNYYEICHKSAQLLIDKQSYQDAKRFSELTKINGDFVIIAQLEKEKESLISSDMWLSKVARRNYWQNCSTCFTQHQVNVNLAAEFFKKESKYNLNVMLQKESECIEDVGEKSVIYEQCLRHIEELATTKDKTLQEDVYRNMWQYRMKHHIQQKESTDIMEPLDEILSSLQSQRTTKKQPEKSELLHFGKMPSLIVETTSLDSKGKEALDELILELLKEGNISESCRVAAVFSHYSQDLAIILTCIRLSIGSITIDMIDPVLKKLLSQFTPRRSISTPLGMTSSVSSISLSSNATLWNCIPIEQERIIDTMDRLIGYCNKAQQFCLRVITSFKVSCVIDLPYQEVVVNNEFDILRELLKTNFAAKFILAKDYLATSSLSNNEVAGFLADSILQTLNYEDCNLENGSPTKRPVINNTGGQQYFKLCQDPSLLGDRLLQAVNTDSTEITRSAMTTQTELLILAHDCYTIACNMEGISHVLRAARRITETLCRSEEFSLMIRLLTGVGRFSEMTYIFDALKLYHQFERLLKKGIEKEDKLKIAILDYLTRFHPSDNDTYTMVALNFMMYREIAQMLEEKGKDCLKSLKSKTIENTKEIQDILKESAQYFADAAERYVKDSCVRHAQQCIRQARLVALQIQLLPSSIVVINLTTEQLTEFIQHHPKFLDTLIVSEAYSKRCDWSTAIYYNVIINNDFRYLHDLKSHVQLKPAIIQDAVDKYQQSGNKVSPEQCLINIKKLLTYCKDIKIQYKIASELGFKDMINQMLKGDSGSYLQDIIALS